MPWPTHGHEVTRGFFRALTRPRQAVRIELRPTYFPGQHSYAEPRRFVVFTATSGMPDAIKPEFEGRRWAPVQSSAQHKAECDCAEFYGGKCKWPKCGGVPT